MTAIHRLEVRGGTPFIAGAPLHRYLDGLKRVVFVEDKRDLHHLTTGDLVVVLGGSAGRSGAMIGKLADRLNRAGAIGLLIHSRSLKDDSQTITAPDGFPIVLVPENIEWAEILQPLLNIDSSLKSRNGNPEQRRQEILAKILVRNGRLDIEAAVGREVGLDPTEPHRCLVVCTGTPMTDPVAAHLEEAVAMALLEQDSLGTVVRRTTGIIALDATGAVTLGPHLLNRARLVDGIETIAVGVGRMHRGARGIFRSYREARWASVVGNRLLGPNRVTRFEELGPYAWLEPLDFDHDGDACAAIETLIAHDTENGTKLLETLQVFLESNRFKQAAEQLFVHRNTLRYRLESIKKLTGLDVLESESRLVLEVQLRLATVRGLVGPNRAACAQRLSDAAR